MRLYASRPGLRARQLAADLAALLWLAGWVLVARAVHGAVLVLAEPARAVAELGSSVSSSMASAARVADEVPVVGEELAAPLGALGDAGSSVGGAGRAAEDAAGTLAVVLAVLLVALPVGLLLLEWLPRRLGWVRAAAAADRLRSADPDVLAARALATAPLHRLAGLPAGTAAAWRAGDPAATRALAAVELARLGLSPTGSGGPGPAPAPRRRVGPG